VESDYTDPLVGNNTFNQITTVLPLALLSIREIGSDTVRLSWSVMLTNYVLQSNPSVNTSSWSTVQAPVVITGDQNTIIQTNSLPATFYRLKK